MGGFGPPSEDLMSKICLIDGDTVAYRCAASVEPTKTREAEPDDLAILRADELMYRILNETQAAEYQVFLSGGEQFRKILYPEYKANRKQPPPRMLGACQEFLVNEWNAKVVHGYEADDAIGMAHDPEKTIVAANDKDFRQLPGEHYNFVKLEWEIIDELTAEFNFWCQMLIGDSSDNVKGVDRIGKAKAPRILTGMSVEQMYETVKELYGDEERFLNSFRMLRILRSPVEFENIMKEIENKNSLGQSEGEEFTENGGAEDFGDVSEAHSQ